MLLFPRKKNKKCKALACRMRRVSERRGEGEVDKGRGESEKERH